MYPEIFNFFLTIIAVVCCSIAIKLADDFLDRETDCIIGKTNWTQVLGQGTMVYAMFFLALAAGINAPLSLALFLGSYVVGMFNSMKDRFPSKLNGFQESFLALAIGLLLFGWSIMLFAVSLVLAIQLFDDYLDARKDSLSGQRNLANKFGHLECLSVGLICFLTAWGVNEVLFYPSVLGTAIVYFASLRFEEAIR